MSQIVLDAIAADLATLTREVPTPAEPFGYGTDLRCTTDVTANLDEVDPFSPVAIVEALIRRLTTPRGRLPDDPEYGLDVTAMVNRGITQSELRDIQTQIRNESSKDDRVDDVAVTVTMLAYNSARIQMMIAPADAQRPFSATLAVTDGQLLMEALS
jgi:hypothetical protein